MPQDKIVVRFQAKGDKALVKAIERLALAQRKLESSTKGATVASDNFQKKQKLVNQRVERNSAAFGKLQSTISVYRNKLLLAAFAVTAFSKTIGALTGKYAEQEAAEKRLDTALGFRSQALLDFASAQQQTTAFGDEVTISAMSQAAAFTMNEAAIKAITVVSQDFAVASKRDLASSMDLIAKSVFSSTNALSRYGIMIDNNLRGTERFNAIMKALNKRFGGQASAELNTYGGATKALSNAWGDLAETLGEALAETLLPLVDAMKDLANWLKDKPVADLATAFSSLAAAVLLTKNRVKGLAGWMVGLSASATKAAGVITFFKRSLTTLVKGGFIFTIIQGIGGLISGFRSQQQETVEVAEATEKLSHRISDLKGKMAGLRTIVEFKAFAKSLGIEELNENLEENTSLWDKNKSALDLLKSGREELLKTHQKEMEAIRGTNNESEKELELKAKHKKALLENREARFKLAKQLEASDEKSIELQKKLNDLGLDYDEIQTKINQLRLQNIAYVAGIIPGLKKQNELLTNQNTLSGEELALANLITEAKFRGIDASELEIDAIEELLDKKKRLTDLLKIQGDLRSGFTAVFMEANKLTGLRMDSFEEATVNALKRIAAEAIATAIALRSVAHAKIFLEEVGLLLSGRADSSTEGNILMSLLKMIPIVGGFLDLFFHKGGEVKGYATGGMITPIQTYQTGGGVDNVPAMLQEGEYVIRRDAVDSIGIENLNRMNRTGQVSGGANITFTGNVLSKDFIEDEAIPLIKSALRKGGDLGIA